MKKKFSAVTALTLTLAMVLTACSGGGGGETTAAAGGDTKAAGETTQAAAPSGDAVKMTMGTGGTTGTYYAFGGVIANVLNAKDIGVNINVQSTGASKANIYLVNDGEAVELPEKYIISTKDTIREPRTAIGQVDANHYVLVVADGRRDGWSDKGMTLQELQQVFVEQGCKVAYNLDGGGSATMILGSERVNKTSGSRERDVSDIVYFTK